MGSLSTASGFDPPLGTFSGRGDFSLGVNMGSNSIPPKTLSDESINRGLVCAHMHFIARTQKILTFMATKNTPSTHHPRRRNVTTLMVGLKTVTYAKISPKSGEPQRYSWGTPKKKKKDSFSFAFLLFLVVHQQLYAGQYRGSFKEDTGGRTQRYVMINTCMFTNRCVHHRPP